MPYTCSSNQSVALATHETELLSLKMTAKKKTVKELTDIIEDLEKRLKYLEDKDNCECLNDLERNSIKIKDEMKKFEEKLSKTDSEIESLVKVIKKKTTGEKEETTDIKCKKCGLKCPSKNDLNEHIKINHPRKNKCNDCDDIFEDAWKFEKHTKTHGLEKKCKCDNCGQTFYTEWRLEKHKESHTNEVLKYCHYFNNFKHCPYEEFGCKFAHKESMNCRFQERCTNRLCQFKHEIKEDKEKTWKCDQSSWMDDHCEFESRKELRLKNHMLAEHEIGEHFICDECDFVEKDRRKLSQHIREDHGMYYETCGGNCSDRLYAESEKDGEPRNQVPEEGF